MRKIPLVVGAVVLVIILVVAAILFYAARNLNSIIAQNRDRILARVSTSLGRKVEVAKINASLGWGVMADLTGVKISDDPAISDQPFLEAADVYAKAELIPLLSRLLHITQVSLKNPEVRIIRTEQGNLNVSTIGKKPAGEAAPAQPPWQSRSR